MAGRSGDWFALLGLPRGFSLDLGKLEKAYRDRSKEFHPDRYVGAEADERVRALQTTMQVNEAYETLKRPHKRAEHLLALWGVTLSDSEPLAQEFLMEIFERREELSAAIAADDRDKLEALEEGMLDRRDEALETIERLLADAESAPDSAVLAEVKRQLVLLRYIDRYLEEFEALDD